MAAILYCHEYEVLIRRLFGRIVALLFELFDLELRREI